MIRHDSHLPDRTDSTSAISRPTIVRDGILSNVRRRRILRYLRDESSAVTIDDLAKAIDPDDGSALDGDRGRSTRIRLHHVDLPMLDDAGYVRYDPERNRATLVE